MVTETQSRTYLVSGHVGANLQNCHSQQRQKELCGEDLNLNKYWVGMETPYKTK